MDPALRNALRDGEQLGVRYALQIPQVAAGGWTGSRSGRRSGSSIDFQDYREYQPGDDLRFIDWGIYSRSDRLVVKLFREEVTPHLDLILDGSASMNLPGTAKAGAVAQLAALLATAAANAQCTQAVWLTGEGCQRLPNDTLPPSAWDKLELDSRRTPEQAYDILPPRLRRLGVRVLVSDLLWPGNPAATLRRLRDGAAALFVIQLLAREDVTPPEHGNIRVADSETGEESEIYIDSAVAKQYADNLAQLQQAWDDGCRQCGARLTTLIAEDLAASLPALQAVQLLTGMIPFLTYPLALIALASLPALAAIYILRNRFRRRTVSSLVLWHFQVQSKAGGAKVHRLQLPLLFFLELLALALLVMAAAGPHWKLPQSARPLMIILDDSFSMRAVSDGVSAQGRAQAFLEKMYRQSPPPVTRLILAGTETHALGSPVKSWAQVAELLRQWRCPAPGAELDAAITLAAELGKQQANILVLTDHRPADDRITNPRLEWRAFGTRLDNFAIVNASRTALGDQDRCLIEVANFSDHARSVEVKVRAGTNALPGSSLTLAAQESQRLVFNLPANGQPLRVALPGDALTVDDQVELLPPVRRRVRVQVALADADLAALADRTLAATGLRAALSDNPELVIHETDAAAGSNAWSLRWVSAGATNAFTGPFVVDTSHPLAAGVTLPGVIWAGASLTNAPGDVPAILAGNTPLLSAREDALGRRHLTLNFNPALSTLQNTPDWPILFWNLLSWRSAELPGLRESNVRLGAEVMVKTTGEPVTVTEPDGTVRGFPKAADELALETPQTGVYQVTMGALTNHFSVNALTAEKSDLTGCASGHWGAWGEAADQRLVETPATWVFGLLGLGLLVTHLFLLYAGKGGGR